MKNIALNIDKTAGLIAEGAVKAYAHQVQEALEMLEKGTGLGNIEIESITIKGQGNFFCLENSLKGTNVETIYRSSGINLDIHTTAIDTQYSEVIV